MLATIRFRYIVDCIRAEIFFWQKYNSENMARNVAAQFPPDLELQTIVKFKIFLFTNHIV